MIEIKTKHDNFTNNNIYTFINKDKNQILKWYLGNNGDLYWHLVNFRNQTNDDNHEFEISIEDYPLYQIIENLADEIKNGDIFINDSGFNVSHSNINYHMNARYITNEIYNPKNDELVWFSDDEKIPNTNSVWIKKENNCYHLSFINIYKSPSTCIRFKVNGSFYGSGYLPFLRAYSRVEKIKDNPMIAKFADEAAIKQKVLEIKREVA